MCLTLPSSRLPAGRPHPETPGREGRADDLMLIYKNWQEPLSYSCKMKGRAEKGFFFPNPLTLHRIQQGKISL